VRRGLAPVPYDLAVAGDDIVKSRGSLSELLDLLRVVKRSIDVQNGL
jgi:hypothetical protein